jgi:hypothetical protein
MLEEERRLCYVAMTRAKTELQLTWRREVAMFTSEGIRTDKRKRSRFLDILIGDKKDKQSSSSSNQYSAKTDKTFGLKPRSSPMTAREQQSSSKNPKHILSTFSVGYTGANSASGNRQLPSTRDGKSFASTRPREQHNSATGPGRERVLPISAPYRQSEASPKQRNSISHVDNNAQIPLKRRNHLPSDDMTIPDYVAKLPSKRDFATTPSRSASQNKAPLNQDSDKRVCSTWFFPVGSEVIHKRLGRGVVLEPPTQPNVGVEWPVRVLFKNGSERIVSAAGTDLGPAL